METFLIVMGIPFVLFASTLGGLLISDTIESRTQKSIMRQAGLFSEIINGIKKVEQGKILETNVDYDSLNQLVKALRPFDIGKDLIKSFAIAIEDEKYFSPTPRVEFVRDTLAWVTNYVEIKRSYPYNTDAESVLYKNWKENSNFVTRQFFTLIENSNTFTKQALSNSSASENKQNFKQLSSQKVAV